MPRKAEAARSTYSWRSATRSVVAAATFSSAPSRDGHRLSGQLRLEAQDGVGGDDRLVRVLAQFCPAGGAVGLCVVADQ
ncbi:hypothetical protein [Streptomyces sp. NPDC053720]|uniref:hypothetical protein n=1 Tax=Streptomyces sp. NPDC053720 TaxID=3154855 RepID=UPI0034239F40